MSQTTRMIDDIRAVMKLHRTRTSKGFYCIECNKLFPCATIEALGNTYHSLKELENNNELE